VRRIIISTRQGRRRAADTLLWLLCYWLAVLFVASTDVFLEGPMGGVWFWVLSGFLMLWTASDASSSVEIPVPQPGANPEGVPLELIEPLSSSTGCAGRAEESW
jgi:hypothetical protein